MIKVCVHHPLNPEKSKKCMGFHHHPKNWTTYTELPFSKDVSVFEGALRNMARDGDISDSDRGELWEEAKTKLDERVVYERVKREKKVQQAIIDEGLRFIPMEEPTLFDLGGRNQLDLNDPRIDEITIKYRD